jgi:hypothetical protein
MVAHASRAGRMSRGVGIRPDAHRIDEDGNPGGHRAAGWCVGLVIGGGKVMRGERSRGERGREVLARAECVVDRADCASAYVRRPAKQGSHQSQGLDRGRVHQKALVWVASLLTAIRQAKKTGGWQGVRSRDNRFRVGLSREEGRCCESARQSLDVDGQCWRKCLRVNADLDQGCRGQGREKVAGSSMPGSACQCVCVQRGRFGRGGQERSQTIHHYDPLHLLSRS